MEVMGVIILLGGTTLFGIWLSFYMKSHPRKHSN